MLRRNLDAATPLRCADTELQSTIEFRTTATQFEAICSSKTGSRRQSGKTTILKHFSKGILKGKSSVSNWKNLLPKHHSQLSRRHYKAIYDPQLQSTLVLRLQLQLRGTLTQPSHCHLQTLSCNTIELQRTTVEHIPWMQQFQCTKHLNTCKTQRHSINKEKKKSPGTFSSTARAKTNRNRKAATPETDARKPTFLSNRSSVYPKKNTMLRANPNIQSASMMQQFQCHLLYFALLYATFALCESNWTQ